MFVKQQFMAVMFAQKYGRNFTVWFTVVSLLSCNYNRFAFPFFLLCIKALETSSREQTNTELNPEDFF